MFWRSPSPPPPQSHTGFSCVIVKKKWNLAFFSVNRCSHEIQTGENNAVVGTGHLSTRTSGPALILRAHGNRATDLGIEPRYPGIVFDPLLEDEGVQVVPVDAFTLPFCNQYRLGHGLLFLPM